MRFVDQNHKNKFFKLIKEGHVLQYDVERQSLFYILSANQELWDHIHDIYDFEEHDIKSDALDKLSLSSPARSMLKLGYKLFNGACKEYNDVSHVFSKLDIENFEVCMYAVRILLGNVETELLD